MRSRRTLYNNKEWSTVEDLTHPNDSTKTESKSYKNYKEEQIDT